MSQYDPPQQQPPAYQPPHAYMPPQPPVAQQQANPLAITAMIAAFVSPASWIFAWIPVIGYVLAVVAPVSAILAVIFGHIALSQIKKTGQAGRGMALTGVIVGYILIGVSILIFILVFAVLGLFAAGVGLSAL